MIKRNSKANEDNNLNIEEVVYFKQAASPMCGLWLLYWWVRITTKN
jgi:hypothetical protein